ncbi:MAG: M23 family metallopeptidase [Elusimicrobia bacterium]|nr:M23 family metallopeptidase [Elusimicrobiota bacterium]
MPLMRALLFLPILIVPLSAGQPSDPQAAGEEAEFARYKKKAKLLKNFHEQGQLDEKPVLEVLQENGLFESSSAEKGFPTGFRPFTVRVYNGLYRWPLKAGVVSSEFGRRWKRRHEGIDIAADEGVPVLASAAGTVLYASDGLRGYGNTVILRHDDKTSTLYAHNQSLLVRKGEKVSAGQQIAALGSTGHSTGPHVHFEFRIKNKAVNPRRKLIRSRF